ncbi:unnamed protein product [Urochloa humidicola]
MEAEIAKPEAAAEAVSSMLSLMSASSGSAGPGSGAGGEFTADDLAAADQLVQLSFSGGGDEEEEEGQNEAAFSSSSARSVNNAKSSSAAARGDEEEEEDSGEVDWRTKKRYRLVAELYAATRPVKAAAGGGRSKRKTSGDGMRK